MFIYKHKTDVAVVKGNHRIIERKLPIKIYQGTLSHKLCKIFLTQIELVCVIFLGT